jgi:hypothetical protein
VLDNLEKTKAPWVVNMLNRVATGTDVETRKLYTDKTSLRAKAECFVALTAVDLPFSNEALYDRMLPIEFRRLAEPLPESAIQRGLSDSYADIWLDLLGLLNAVVAALHVHKQTAQKHRLADFADFCSAVAEAGVVDGRVLLEGVAALGKSQSRALAANSPLIDVLDEWLRDMPDDAVKPHTAGELLAALRPQARGCNIVWRWNSPNGLALHLKALQPALEQRYGLRVESDWDNAQRKHVTKYIFAGDHVW